MNEPRDDRKQTAEFWLDHVTKGDILQAVEFNQQAAIEFFGPLPVMRRQPSELESIALAIKIEAMSDEDLIFSIKEADARVEAELARMDEERRVLTEFEIDSVVSAFQLLFKSGVSQVEEYGFVNPYSLPLAGLAALSHGGASISATLNVLRQQARRIIRGAKA